VLDVSEDSVVIEISDEADKIESMEKMLRRFGIKELVRTGKIALERGG
jgi:acetolactate synthase-1/3 small subunit